MTAERVHQDVVIAGGGSVGLALACALADALGADARITIVDRAPLAPTTLPRDVRASALAAGSKRLLEALGVWQVIA